MLQNFANTFPYLIGILSFLIGLVCMPIVIELAKQKHFVVKPNKRTSHIGEIPNIGGLDICLSFLLTFTLFQYNNLPQSRYLLIGSIIILFVGFTDDILDLCPWNKIIGEMIAGLVLISLAPLRITHLHGIFTITQLNLPASLCISYLVLLTIINAINLIDGIDGLASALGIIYCTFFGVYFQFAQQTAWAVLAYTMAGSLAVFFIYNVFGKTNKIFMGDSGALLLGYMLSAFAFQFLEINAGWQVPTHLHCNAAPAVVITILTIPIFDTIRVVLTRIKHHKSPFMPDRNHIHHLMLNAGLTHIQTTLILSAVSLLFVLLAWIGRNWNFWILLSTDFFIATTLTIILWRVIDRKNHNNNQDNA